MQHARINGAGWVVVSLYSDRRHQPGIFVATGSERAGKLVSMLLLNVAQQMFRVSKLPNKEEDLLLCVLLGKRSSLTQNPLFTCKNQFICGTLLRCLRCYTSRNIRTRLAVVGT